MHIQEIWQPGHDFRSGLLFIKLTLLNFHQKILSSISSNMFLFRADPSIYTSRNFVSLSGYKLHFFYFSRQQNGFSFTPMFLFHPEL